MKFFEQEIIRLNNETDTRALGHRIAEAAEPGDVVALIGDLGTGKTALTKYIAEGLGIKGDISSPTFTIVKEYRSGRLPLYHFDVYRLGSGDELIDIGAEEMLDGDGVCVIEWGEQFADEIGSERLDVYLTRLDAQAAAGEEPPREVRLVAHGPRAEELVAAVA